jgi:hypothetical protein
VRTEVSLRLSWATTILEAALQVFTREKHSRAQQKLHCVPLSHRCSQEISSGEEPRQQENRISVGGKNRTVHLPSKIAVPANPRGWKHGVRQ